MIRPNNPPQHIFDNGTGITEGTPSGRTAREGAHRQTGAHTAPDPALEVEDPHPSDEGHPYRPPFPERGESAEAARLRAEIGPNPAVHDGTAPPRPHNRGSGPA